MVKFFKFWDPRVQFQILFFSLYTLSLDNPYVNDSQIYIYSLRFAYQTFLKDLSLWSLQASIQQYKNKTIIFLGGCQHPQKNVPYFGEWQHHLSSLKTRSQIFHTAHSSLPPHSQYPSSFTKSNWLFLPILKSIYLPPSPQQPNFKSPLQ